MDDRERAVDPWLTQLAELCRANRTGAKWVIVPTHALGWTLGERLALEGTDWANLRFHTPFDLALRMAAPALVERGVDPAPDGLGPALIMRLLMDLPASVPSYFRELAEQPKMADALWATLRELRMAGLASDDLRRDAFARPAKAVELRALLAAYERHLMAERLADTGAVFTEALAHVGAGPVLAGDVWIELPGVLWSPLERRLLDALPGTRLTPRRLALPGLEAPRRLALLAAPAEPVPPAPTTDAGRLAFLMKPDAARSDAAPQPVADGTLAMFRAGGREAEIEEVVRRVLAAGVALDHVEVACASAHDATLFWEQARRHEWPVTVATGVPVTLTRPARALLAFCRWVEGGFSAGALRRMLQSGDLALDLDDGPSAGQAARLLSGSDATWGRQTYAPALAALAEHHRERAAETDGDELREWHARAAAQAGRLAGWIGDLLALVPEERDDRRVTFATILDACGTFVDRWAAVGNDHDAAAKAALRDALGELRALGDLAQPLDRALALVRDRLEGVSVGADRARPGHLHVTPLAHAGYAGRPVTFVVGLEENRVLPPLVEDPVLLDAERERLHPALASSGDRVSEALAAIVGRLAALGGRVCLSFACRDLREHRELFPSWILLQALRLVDPRARLTYGDLDAALGEPVSPVPAAPALALSDAGWWLAHLRDAGSLGRDAVRAAFPALARGEDAEAERDSERFTAWDGHVPAAGPLLDPRSSGRAVSATTLEGLAACPFRYFIERGLGVEAIEDAEPEPGGWLDPRRRGTLLHELYAAIYRELRERSERADPQRHGPRLHALAAAKLEELRQLIPPLSERVFEDEARGLYADLDAFLRLEAGATGRTPVGFEVSFGRGDTEREPLAQAEPLELDLGRGLRFSLRGSIDRVDRLGGASYEVVDYKTGRRWLPGGIDAHFAGGRQLQHALYALAAERLLQARGLRGPVTVGSYYFPTARGGGWREPRQQGDRAAVSAVLRDLFDVLAAGAFVHSPDDDDCRYCEVARACGRNPAGRAARKIAGDGNEALAAYRRLADRE